ncbi:MAG: aminoglycoside phosphotransferase family protein [Patescibacteria group bacterium]
MNIKSPSTSQVKKICSKFIKGDIVVKRRDREGGDSIVFDVYTNSKEYIFRVNGVRQNYDVEHAVLQLARQNGVKVPVVIAENANLDKFPFTFSLQERLSGVELEHLTLKVWPKIFGEAGQELFKLYKIKVKGFGAIDASHYRKTGEITGSSLSWKNTIQALCVDRFNEIAQKIEKEKDENFIYSKLTRGQKVKLLEIYKNFDKITSKLNNLEEFTGRPSILHGDLQRHNFIVENNHLTGIIDFNNVIIGDPLFDIAISSVMPHGEFYKHLLKTSKVKMDNDRFTLYRLIIATRKIHTRYVRFDYLHQYPEILDIVLEEVKKLS